MVRTQIGSTQTEARQTKVSIISSKIYQLNSAIIGLEDLSCELLGRPSDSRKEMTPDPDFATLYQNLPALLSGFTERIQSLRDEFSGLLL